MKIILIAGGASSGKTYLGERILLEAKAHSLRAIQTEFSKYIKMYAKEIIGYDGNRENKPRKFLQDMGSFIRVSLNDEYFFIRRMFEDLKIYENYFDIVVISDVHLEKELEELKRSKYDVVTILVKNENINNKLTIEEQNHITEHDFKKYNDYDYIVNNEEINIFAKIILENIKIKIEGE